MKDEIDQVLVPIFNSAQQTPEINDFYREVAADLFESASALQQENPELSDEEAVQRALLAVGDLRPVIDFIASQETANGKTVGDAINSSERWIKKGQREVLRVLPSDQVQNLNIIAQDASVNFTASMTYNIEIEYRQKGINGQTIQTEIRDGNVRVVLPKPRSIDYLIPLRHPHQQLEVRLPLSFLGSVRLDARNGNVNLRNFETPDLDIAVILTAGNLRITNVQANRFDFGTKSGNIRIEQSKADFWRLVARAGNVRVDDVTGKFDVAVRSANIVLDETIGSGTFKVTSGNIRTNWRQVTGDLSFAADSGTIKSRVPVQDGFNFNLQAQQGIVRLAREAQYEVRVQGYAKGKTLTSSQYNIVARVKSGLVRID